MIKVSVAGGSGFTGGELLRLLFSHPEIEVAQVSSERFAGKGLSKVHPHLRKVSELKFSPLSEFEKVDLLCLCLPHGKSSQEIEKYLSLAERIVDLSADFRLSSPQAYKTWYGEEHKNPAYLEKFIYGIPELHREEMKTARFISSAGCNATATILALYPLFKAGVVEHKHTVVEVKVGSSEGGNAASDASHHPIRAGCVRSFMPTGHRHTAEMLQELNFGKDIYINFSATSIDMVRGVLATSHVFLNRDLSEKDIWKIYRETYADEPFIRIVKEPQGNYRFPEPKILSGTNFCDIGFEKDPHSNRLVVISAIDNLMKGAAGQALQAINLMHGFDERTGLSFSGLHPI